MATMPKTSPRTKSIEVFAEGHAVKDPEYLSKANHEEAEFFSTRDVEVVFDFSEGTPFRNGNRFPVTGGQPATPSGPMKDTVQVGERYRYHVNPLHGAGGGADPTIIVN